MDIGWLYKTVTRHNLLVVDMGIVSFTGFQKPAAKQLSHFPSRYLLSDSYSESIESSNAGLLVLAPE